jgi:hypothetical protein
MHLSLLTECRDRIERALAVVGTSLDASREMKLRAAVGTSLLHQRGGLDGVGAAYRRVLEIAESLNDAEYQLRSLWGLWAFHLVRGQWRVALEQAERFAALAVEGSDPNGRAIADRLIGFSLHYLGDQTSAHRHIERMLTNFDPAPGRLDATIRFHFDQRIVARSMLGRVLWLQGFPDQARHIVATAVEHARTINAITMWDALTYGACPVSLLISDLSAAQHYVEILLDYSTRYASQLFRDLGRCFQALLIIRRGGVTGTLSVLLGDFYQALAGVDRRFYVMFLGQMAHTLGGAGRATEGLAAVQPAIDQASRFEESWLLGELLRVKGELSLLQLREAAAPVAEDCFREALDSARQQGALS